MKTLSSNDSGRFQSAKDRLLPLTQPPQTVRHNIFDSVFKPVMTIEQASHIFEQKKRKSMFGLFDGGEKIAGIFEGYAPIASYLLEKTKERTFPPGSLASSGKNRFYVNLNNCALLFVNLGFNRKNPTVKNTDVLQKIIDLPEPSVRILSDIVENEQIRFDKISPDYMMFLQQNNELLMSLIGLELISFSHDLRGYVSNLNMPRFTDKRYDLSAHILTEKSFASTCQPDTIIYSPEAVLELLSDFLKSDGVFEAVTYMSYFRAKYVGRDGLLRSDELKNVGFING